MVTNINASEAATIAFLALVAVAFASPKPEPQAVVYPGPSVYPAAYPWNYAASVYGAAPYAAVPYAYNPYFIR